VKLVGSSIEENVTRTSELALYARSQDISVGNVQTKIRNQPLGEEEESCERPSLYAECQRG
jgi:hypothetical protein